MTPTSIPQPKLDNVKPNLPTTSIMPPSSAASIISTPNITPMPAPTPPMREFGDALQTRKNIYDETLAATQSLEPLEDDKYSLRLTNVGWQDPERFSRKARKQAVLTGNTLARRMKGTWQLYDKTTGELLKERSQIIGAVPYMSSMGTFVHNGNEYTLSHQQRLKGGVFARVKDNGELESHFNIMPGKGVSHRYFLEPSTGTFKMKFGQGETPLMPLLKAMGATDKELQAAWGNDVWQANMAKNDTSSLRKLAAKLLRKKELNDTDEGSITKKLVDRFNNMELDPSVTQRTLGAPHDRVNKEAILAATSKLLKVSKKEAEPDDRDHLAYQQFLGPEDLFAERIKKDHGSIRRNILKKIAFAGGDLAKMPSGLLTPQLEQVLIGSGLSQALEEINPAEVFDKQTKITRMGEGGIPSLEAIPDDARSVQPSHMGFLDPSRTPESMRAGIDLHMTRGSRKGRDGKIYTSMRDRAGNVVWKTPEDLAEAAIATPDVVKWDTDVVPVMKAGKLDYLPKDQIDYTIPNFSDVFSPLANLVPFMSATKPGRVAMGSRYMTQALPLTNAEAPFVRGGLPDKPGRSYEEEYGKHMGAVHADQGGKVTKIDNGVIHVQYDDGKTDEIELYENHPFNRKSVTGDTQIYVKRGDEVRALSIASYVWQTGDLTLSIDPVTKKSAWMEVTGYLKHANDKKLYQVTTDSGRKVVVTEDHSLMTIGSDGHLCPVYPLDCIVGVTRLPVAMLPNIDTEDKNDTDIGYLDGLYLAEGHCAVQNGLICIAVADTKRANEVLELLKRIGISAYRNGGNVCFTDHDRYERFKTQFGHLAHNKFVPDWVLTASFYYRCGLVAGYMGGDDCLWSTGSAVQVAAVSVSEQLRNGLISVLSTLGVFCTKFDAPRNHMNPNWRDGYGLRVIARHLHKLPKWFFYTDREKQFRKILKRKYRASPFESVPVPNAKARRVLYAGYDSVPKYVQKTAHGGLVAKHRLAGVTGPYGAWGKSDVMWDRIISILPMKNKKWVYDLCVKDAEAFAVCQGLVVHNTYIHQTPAVQPGDTFKPGQLLARSNYTDDKGATALGLNLKVAYMAYKGLNFEDASVISESAAKRLSSEHMYQHDLDVSDKHKVGKKSFISLFPGKYDKKTLEKLDEHGVIRVGQTVDYGDPIVLAAKERERADNRIHKKRQPGYSDDTITWKHHDQGVVTDVVWGKNGPTVLVKAKSQTQVGDKLSGRYGDKGVVSAIIPDDQMPKDKDGNPFEILLSPDGTITRTNPSQQIEASLGKLAAKTGRPVVVPDFHDIDDLNAWAKEQLSKHGLKGEESVYWPEKNTTINDIDTGYRFMMKLHHTAESKGQGRDSGAYSTDETPAKGGDTGCFVGDTLVSCYDVQSPSDVAFVGRTPILIPIRDIVQQRTRTYVPTTSLHSCKVKPRNAVSFVVDWFTYRVYPEELITLTLENSQVITCTKSHEFILKNGKRKCAGDLTVEDELMEAT